jgi:hypothetical protein
MLAALMRVTDGIDRVVAVEADAFFSEPPQVGH